jgi:hypothetical protein
VQDDPRRRIDDAQLVGARHDVQREAARSVDCVGCQLLGRQQLVPTQSCRRAGDQQQAFERDCGIARFHPAGDPHRLAAADVDLLHFVTGSELTEREFQRASQARATRPHEYELVGERRQSIELKRTVLGRSLGVPRAGVEARGRSVHLHDDAAGRSVEATQETTGLDAFAHELAAQAQARRHLEDQAGNRPGWIDRGPDDVGDEPLGMERLHDMAARRRDCQW